MQRNKEKKKYRKMERKEKLKETSWKKGKIKGIDMFRIYLHLSVQYI